MEVGKFKFRKLSNEGLPTNCTVVYSKDKTKNKNFIHITKIGFISSPTLATTKRFNKFVLIQELTTTKETLEYILGGVEELAKLLESNACKE